MKRTAIFVLILVLTLCLLTGCRGANQPETTAPTTTAAPTTTVATTPSTRPTTMPTVPSSTGNSGSTDTTGMIEGIIDDVTGNGGTPSSGAGRSGGARG